MSRPPEHVRLNFTHGWIARQPYVYRYIDNGYVEQFFSEGLLRISSFAQFALHQDEARRDGKEGEGLVVHQHNEGKGQHISGYLRYGENAYVLCGSQRYDKDIMRAFGTDSGFRINDVIGFANAVSAQIPGFHVGMSGPCIYLPRRIVHRNIGQFDEALLHDDKDSGRISIEKMQTFLSELDNNDQCFLKYDTFAYQNEFRLIWNSINPTKAYLDLYVPAAISFCTRIEELEIEHLSVEPHA